MEGIYWLYIIDSKGATIFSYQKAIHGTSQINSTLLSHFIYALQSVAETLEEDEIKEVDIGNNKFFIAKDKLTSYLLIIKTKTDAESKILTSILKNIKKEFIRRFTGHFSLDVDKKIEILKSFEKYVTEIFEGKSGADKLIETLSSD